MQIDKEFLEKKIQNLEKRRSYGDGDESHLKTELDDYKRINKMLRNDKDYLGKENLELMAKLS